MVAYLPQMSLQNTQSDTSAYGSDCSLPITRPDKMICSDKWSPEEQRFNSIPSYTHRIQRLFIKSRNSEKQKQQTSRRFFDKTAGKIPRICLIALFFLFVMTTIALLLLSLLLGFQEVKADVHHAVHKIDLGYSKYIGVAANDSGVSKWLGIRYAAPPIGNLRFRAPVDPEVDDKTHLADKHAPPCHATPSTRLSSQTSEDCLFLDVYAPSTPGPHPVYVYIQGGGLNDLSNPNLDGTKLVAAGDYDIVVVVFNYRVGPFGFLASKEIRENGDLNAGLLDQRKVLEWIQKYIDRFGGDPDHVTIGGSSAGAGSVALHLTAYGGRDDGLFHAAIAGSPSFGAKTTVEGSQYQYDTLVERVNCTSAPDTLQCLRDVDIDTLARNNQNIPQPNGSYPVFTYTNVIDGNFTTSNMYNLFTSGNFVKVPVIFGDDTDEGTIFTPAAINNVTDMNNFLKDNFPKLSSTQLDTIDSFYPKDQKYPNKGDYWSAAADAYGEMRYVCPGIHISTQYSKNDVFQNWNFRWDVLERQNAASGLGVTHTSDLSSIWGTSQPPEKPLIPTIQSYWTSFIRTYNPNTLKLNTAPLWEPFVPEHMARLRFAAADDVSMEKVDENQQERCSWLEAQSGSLST
ncbi:Acetylcholinesterase [Golovinomyces cichoracearum]|uniref:Carboxylic ester hydrolase n=1 Tax=Golovinomyces cichoracearum TaxID=62708 RepID=A0A420INF8_9PEZI|nr:Acetylcholinesterase [Golovinomyces cichoracearum]